MDTNSHECFRSPRRPLECLPSRSLGEGWRRLDAAFVVERCDSLKHSEKLSTFCCDLNKIGAPRADAIMRQRDSRVGWARIVKEHFTGAAIYLVLLIGICLIPFALAERTMWRAPANTITVTNLNDSGPGS